MSSSGGGRRGSWAEGASSGGERGSSGCRASDGSPVGCVGRGFGAGRGSLSTEGGWRRRGSGDRRRRRRIVDGGGKVGGGVGIVGLPGVGRIGRRADRVCRAGWEGVRGGLGFVVDRGWVASSGKRGSSASEPNRRRRGGGRQRRGDRRVAGRRVDRVSGGSGVGCVGRAVADGSGAPGSSCGKWVASAGRRESSAERAVVVGRGVEIVESAGVRWIGRRAGGFGAAAVSPAEFPGPPRAPAGDGARATGDPRFGSGGGRLGRSARSRSAHEVVRHEVVRREVVRPVVARPESFGPGHRLRSSGRRQVWRPPPRAAGGRSRSSGSGRARRSPVRAAGDRPRSSRLGRPAPAGAEIAGAGGGGARLRPDRGPGGGPEAVPG